MKYILGSGLIAFIAKALYPTYKIIPIGKSRYYSFSEPIAENYLTYDEKIESFIKDVIRIGVKQEKIPIIKGDPNVILFKRAWSYNGALDFNVNNSVLKDKYFNKVYDSDPNPVYKHLNYDVNFVFDVTAKDLFDVLEKENAKNDSLVRNDNNTIKSIDLENKIIIMNDGVGYPFEKIINTAPLNYLYKLLDIQHDLKSKTLFCCSLATDALDFEGATELLCVDSDIFIYKSTYCGDSKYKFYFTEDVGSINHYMRGIIGGSFRIIEYTSVANAIPLGNTELKIGDCIYNVGANARWDDLMDVSSCIKHLINHNDLAT